MKNLIERKQKRDKLLKKLEKEIEKEKKKIS